jgi:hypothetical protein
VAINYLVNLEVEPENAGQTSGGGYYHAGEPVSIHAEPAHLNSFSHWSLSGATISVEEDYTFLMPTSDLSLTANFNVKKFIIEAVPNNPAAGTITGSGEYFRGTTVGISAMPETGYQFILWVKDENELLYGNPLSVLVDTSHQFTAYFQLQEPCLAPVALGVSDITKSTANLRWIASGNVSNWDLLWGEHSFDTVTGGNLVSGIPVENYLLENLIPETEYDFYVRTVCENGNSHWEGPFEFITQPVGIQEIDDTQPYLVYPNPANQEINIRMNEPKLVDFKVEIFTCDGQKVYTGIKHSDGLLNIRLTNITPGIYLLRICQENIIYNKKLIIIDY